MLFSSPEFIFLFMPVTLAVYFLCPLKWRNAVLLAFSLVFYGLGEPVYVFLMIFTVSADYLFGRLIGKYRDKPKKAKTFLVLSVILNLAILAFFKYTGFVIDNLRLIPAFSGLRPFRPSLPIGISFYTFQALSYVIDVYRGDAEAQKNIINFGTYVTLFPQLIAGPIVRYKDIDDQLSGRKHDVALAASGARTFVAGLCKKVLLANAAGEMWKYYGALPADQLTCAGSWLGIFCYAFHIYFDFSGYSDMAIGLGKIFGFRFLENFNYPYISKSITEFWRRWHISLSGWFREYVYIPLGGNRKGKKRMYFNLFVVWLLTGIWHGACWNFVLWGLYYAVLLVVEKAFLGKFLEKLPAVFGHVYCIFFVLLGWVLFAFDSGTEALSFADGLRYLKTMFGFGGAGFSNRADAWDISRSLFSFAVMIFACLPAGRKAFWKACEKYKAVRYAVPFLNVIMLVICTAYLIDSTFNPFLYFRF